MLNSDQLTEQFKKKAMEIQPPASHMESIRVLYEADQKRRNHGTQRSRPTLLKFVLAFALVLIISGFTSYIWYQYSDNRVSVQYTQSAASMHDDVLSSQIHVLLMDVKAKLEVGESAIVYLPELTELFKKDILTAVSNPTVLTQLTKWKTILVQNAKEYKLPSSESNGLNFVGGQEELPFGSFISLESHKLLSELKKESEASEGKVVWRKQFSKRVEQVFTTFYHNERQDEIYVSMKLIEEKTDYKIISANTEKDTINVNGVEVHYFNTQPFFLSDSNRVQEMQWLETYADYTLVYSVGSTSSTITKEELLSIVNEMV